MDAQAVISSLDERFKQSTAVAAVTGVLTGGIAAWDRPGSSFVAVASQVAAMTIVPVYFMPDFTYLQVATANAALMTGVCLGFHQFDSNGCAKYALLVGSLTYAVLCLIGPEVAKPQ